VSTDNEVSLSNALMEMGEQTWPIFDHAKGMRTCLEAEGWSPTTAETMALEWCRGAISYLFRKLQ
jgi:hypothetical protein